MNTPEADEPRGTSRPHRSRTRKLLLSILSILLVIAVGCVGFAGYLAHRWNSGTQQLNVTELQSPNAADGPGTNILILGTDTRSEDDPDQAGITGTRSDAIMVAHIAANGSGVQVVSLPRDLWVPIKGHGEDKLNAAMSYGGANLAVSTIHDLIGVRIDHVAIIDFEGFRGLTDALGGVDVPVYKEFTSYGRTFPEGLNHLDGDGALSFVRARYPFADGDFQRIRNQQAFLKAVISKLVSVGTLTNPVKVTRAVDQLSPYLTVDDGLDARGMVSLLTKLRGVEISEFRFMTLPTGDPGTSEDGAEYLTVDEDALSELRTAFTYDTLDRTIQKMD
ncbi:LCP family protein [Corynebacterium terpenotabidum]|uniref:Cell envelope-related function transcriptional attenuator common domain protein n=1 Tax=Corynebacterium terpenotabidum Y-11 TaxID=1200352 RepID=S4XHK7_9CORY|nr:LCP family protein [Corynebacterium terpenotabidum]AGP30128.1 cell envelope-related function transcriptional attenuator common domain protein [Corynebacterium terpenotabidum Y-11]